MNNIVKGIDWYCFTNNKNIKAKTLNIVYIGIEKLKKEIDLIINSRKWVFINKVSRLLYPFRKD